MGSMSEPDECKTELAASIAGLRLHATALLTAHARKDGSDTRCRTCGEVFPCAMASRAAHTLGFCDVTVGPVDSRARVSRGEEGCR